MLDPNRERLQDGRQVAAGSKAPGKGSVEQLYLEQVETIRKLAAYACRRYGFSREDVEEFSQDILVKIWGDHGECAVLKNFKGRSNLTSYLAVVVQRALLDHVNSRWGKWRPSKAAQRLGKLAIDLERLLVRDRLGFDQACQTLRLCGATATDAELNEIAVRLPPRPPRPIEGSLDGAGGSGDVRGAGMPGHREPVAVEKADDGICSSERQQRWQHAKQALASALAALPAEDCLIAKMLAEFKVVEIAAHLGLDPKAQKALYKRTEKIKKRLREAVESAGVSAADVAEILGDADS